MINLIVKLQVFFDTKKARTIVRALTCTEGGT